MTLIDGIQILGLLVTSVTKLALKLNEKTV